MPNKINEIGLGRYVGNILTILGCRSKIKLKIIKYIKIIFYFKTWVKSKNIQRYLISNTRLTIPLDSRSLKIPPNTLVGINDLINHCKKVYFNQKKDLKINYTPPYKPLIGIFKNSEISENQCHMIKPILKFASQPILMNTIARYLNRVPTLVTANLLYSEAMKKNQKAANAQRYHTDMLDPSLLHLIIPIYDISENNGPFTYIDVKTSKKIMNAIDHQRGRIDDGVVLQFAKKKNINKLTGKSGDAWLMSPYHSIHMGSRVKSGFRLLLIISYAAPLHAIEHVNYLHRKKIQDKLLNELSTQNERDLLRVYSQ